MKREELIEWSRKGILSDIRDLENQVNKGIKFLNMIEKGERPPTKLSIHEIQNVINEKAQRN